MNNKLCPWMGRECQSVNCALWIKSDGGGRCAVVVIAEEMSAGNDNTAVIGDSVADIARHITPVK